MKKLTLDLDKLAVESFAAMSEEALEGTVVGQQMISPGRSCLRTACCPETYEASCAATCTC